MSGISEFRRILCLWPYPVSRHNFAISVACFLWEISQSVRLLSLPCCTFEGILSFHITLHISAYILMPSVTERNKQFYFVILRQHETKKKNCRSPQNNHFLYETSQFQGIIIKQQCKHLHFWTEFSPCFIG